MYYPSDKLAHIVYSESKIPFVAVKSTPYEGNGISRIKNMLGSVQYQFHYIYDIYGLSQ